MKKPVLLPFSLSLLILRSPSVTGESGLFIFCLLILFCSGRRDPVECLLQNLLEAAERYAEEVQPNRAEDETWIDEDTRLV